MPIVVINTKKKKKTRRSCCTLYLHDELSRAKLIIYGEKSSRSSVIGISNDCTRWIRIRTFREPKTVWIFGRNKLYWSDNLRNRNHQLYILLTRCSCRDSMIRSTGPGVDEDVILLDIGGVLCLVACRCPRFILWTSNRFNLFLKKDKIFV